MYFYHRREIDLLSLLIVGRVLVIAIGHGTSIFRTKRSSLFS